MTHALYRIYDHDDVLLYVGISSDARRRFGEHSKAQPWWNEVALIRIERHLSKEAAEAEEKRVIVDERPLYNVIHVPKVVEHAPRSKVTQLRCMTTRGSTQRRFRLCDDTEWDEFEAAARRQGTDRSSLLRDFIAYYLRRPGAKMPRRPEIVNTPTTEDE